MFQWGLSFFGPNCEFMGIDNNYIVNIAMKEIYNLVRIGFGYSDLRSMALAQRRYYFHLLVKENEKRQKELDAQNAK